MKREEDSILFVHTHAHARINQLQE